MTIIIIDNDEGYGDADSDDFFFLVFFFLMMMMMMVVMIVVMMMMVILVYSAIFKKLSRNCTLNTNKNI